MNAKSGKDRKNKFCLHNSPNKNGEYRAEFSLENRLLCQNNKFKKILCLNQHKNKKQTGF